MFVSLYNSFRICCLGQSFTTQDLIYVCRQCMIQGSRFERKYAEAWICS